MQSPIVSKIVPIAVKGQVDVFYYSEGKHGLFTNNSVQGKEWLYEALFEFFQDWSTVGSTLL